MCWSNKLVGHLWKFFSAFNGKVFNRISWAGDHGHRRYLFGEGRWNYTLFERKLFLPEHCWKMMENGWTWFSLSSFLVGRTQQQTETFAEFLLISDWRIRHSQIIPKVRPDLEWIFCLPPFVLAHSSSKVTAGRVVGYKNLSWAAGMVFMHDYYRSNFGTRCQYISIFQFGCSFLENPEHHACKLASPYISWFMFRYKIIMPNTWWQETGEGNTK